VPLLAPHEIGDNDALIDDVNSGEEGYSQAGETNGSVAEVEGGGTVKSSSCCAIL